MNHNFTKATLYLTISSFIFLAAGYVINVWLGRYLGPVDYGKYGIVISLMSLVNVIQTAGLPQAVSKYISERDTDAQPILRSGFLLQICSTFVITLLYFLLADPVSTLLNDSSLVPYLQFSALIFPFYSMYTLNLGYYNGLQQFGRQAILSSLYSVAKVGGVIGLAFMFRIYGAVAGFILAPAVALLAGFRIPSRGKAHFSYKKLFSFSLPLIGIAFFGMLLQSLDLYLIKAFLADTEAPGFYTASQNIARIPFFALSAISFIVFPSISRGISRKETEKTQTLVREAIRGTLILVAPLVSIISADSAQIVGLLYQDTYILSAIPLSILVFGFGLLTCHTVLINIINGAGKPFTSLAITGSAVITTALLAILFIPAGGLSAAALATTLGALGAVIAGSIVVYRKFRTLISISSAMRILIASTIVYSLSRYVTTSSIALPFFYLFLGVVYIGMLILFKELNKRDFDRLRHIV